MTKVTRKSLAATEDLTSPTLLDLLPSFRRHLAADNLSPRTIKSYTEAVHRLHEFLTSAGLPTGVGAITKGDLESFQADQLARLRPSSARARHASLKQFWKWVAAEHAQAGWWGKDRPSPMASLGPPRVPAQPVDVLTVDQLSALLRTVDRERDFFGVRDAALIRTFVATGARLSEVAALALADVNLDARTVRFLGKGGSHRTNPIGSKAVRALDRYLLARRQHPDRDVGALWLGGQGALSSYGVAEAVKRRARQAGIGDVHVHQLRHSVAHYLRLKGVDDDSVMRLMGWRDRSMLHRYGASAADERAHEAYQRVGMGDWL